MEGIILNKTNLSILPVMHATFAALSRRTIARLITRLYESIEVQVLFDTRIMRTLNIRNLRSLISSVQQKPSLLEGAECSSIARGLVHSSISEHTHPNRTVIDPSPAMVARDLP